MRQPSLDRTALERVLARAAELQGADADPGELLTEEQLLEVGREVGIAPQHIRQALAEERTRVNVPVQTGTMGRLFGPVMVFASRVVGGTTDAALAAVDAWMQSEECLQVKRRFGERSVWEPRQGFLSEMRRTLKIGGRGYHLSRVHEVAATAFPVDADRVLVRMEADLSNLRSQRLVSAGMTTSGGLVVAGVLLSLGYFEVAAALPALAGLGGGYAVARSHAPVAARAQLALEQVLDRLERGEMPRPSLMSALTTPRLSR